MFISINTFFLLQCTMEQAGEVASSGSRAMQGTGVVQVSYASLSGW